MYKFSKKTVYAIEAVALIATADRDNPAQAKDLAQKMGVPPRYLEQALQRLVRDGLLLGIRGPRGGYCLSRKPDDIDVVDIADIVRDMEPSTEEDGFDGRETRTGRMLAPLLDDVARRVDACLEGLTVADLLADRPVPLRAANGVRAGNALSA